MAGTIMRHPVVAADPLQRTALPLQPRFTAVELLTRS